MFKPAAGGNCRYAGAASVSKYLGHFWGQCPAAWVHLLLYLSTPIAL